MPHTQTNKTMRNCDQRLLKSMLRPADLQEAFECTDYETFFCKFCATDCTDHIIN